MILSRTVVIALFLIYFNNRLIAQEVAVTDFKARPVANAVALASGPIMDGDVLKDEIWQQIEPFGEMSQTQPNFGMPATEKTEIRIAYTQETFFVSVVCYDAQPDNLVVSDARRDADLNNTDAFLFILDTYKDGQN
ncbi:MAG: hydrolase, partial [Flavobacteriales bacterium]